MIQASDILAAAIYLLGRIPEKAARNALISSMPMPMDGKELVLWVNDNFKNLPFSDTSLWERAQLLIDNNLQKDITPIGIGSSLYPNFLRIIADPPPLIFVRGNLQLLSASKMVAVVGTRNASEAGLEIAKRIAIHIGKEGWCVVSGLALGIDAAAHEGALLSGTPTIAVLAHGLEQANPRKNAKLADQILSGDGIWLSEHSIGEQPRKDYFVRRNRIQIGLSSGSIIVEAALRSGSMAQANYCVSEKRPLFAVVPQTSSNQLNLVCDGTLDMVNRLGAIPIKGRNDYSSIIHKLEESRGVLIDECKSNFGKWFVVHQGSLDVNE